MKIYNVMNTEEWVGTFYQCSFSTPELAQAYIDKAMSFPDNSRENFSIQEHEVDSAVPFDSDAYNAEVVEYQQTGKVGFYMNLAYPGRDWNLGP